MRTKTHLYFVQSSNGGLRGTNDCYWVLWVTEEGDFEDRQNLIMSWQFPVKPTKKQVRMHRRQFRKEITNA